ncbi:MAG TPA: GAF domain-containing protein [Anaerolineae bacterium]|nr:GAF domain-containing protein [Anaerolineae bacterium]HQK13021.1 GAF domain-containing protein [Anaerolineae bacterium]
MVLEMQTQDTRDVAARPKIGVLVAETLSWWSQYLLSGVIEAAEAFDVDLFCYVGGGLQEPDQAVDNGLYELVSTDLLDGLIVSGNIAHGVTQATFDAFLRRFADSIPIVTVVGVSEGLSAVLVDGFGGMYKVISHLIEDHGYRQIAFIRGPVGQIDADERYRAYVEALEKHNLPLNPDWVVEGNFSSMSGQSAMQKLWPRIAAVRASQTPPLPWAIVAANDDMARGVLNVLYAQGINVPDEVAVVGFDDSDIVRNLDVPLTSVRQPIVAMARRALELLLRQLRGDTTVVREAMPAEPVIRRSCGCLPPAVREEEMTSLEERGADTPEYIPPCTCVPAAVWEAFHAALQVPATPESSADFLRVLDHALRRTQGEGGRLEDWHRSISELRHHSLPYLFDPAMRQRAEDLLQQARVLVSDAIRRAEAYGRQLFQQRQALLTQVDDTLSTTLHLQELPPVLERLFPNVGVQSCLAALYDGENPRAEFSRFLFAYDSSRAPQVDFYADGLPFRSWLLAPWERLGEGGRKTYIVVPLTLQEHRLGFLLLWAGQDWQLYARLAQRLSDVIFRSLLLQEQERARREALEAEQRAEVALRDALVAQRRYVRGAWQERAEPVVGYFYSPETHGVTDSAWLPEMTEAVRQGDVVVTRDLDGGQTLAVPVVLYGEEIIGVLGFRTTDAAPWTEDHIALARTIATEMALALETQRLLSDVQRRASRLMAAAEISRVTTSILTLDELLPQAVNLIRERFDLYYAGIFLVDEGRRWAILRAGTGEAGRIMLKRGHRLEVGGNSMIGMCVAQGEARITFDTHRETVRRPNPLLPDTRSELALPLFSRGRVIGAMTIQDTRPGAFTQEDITILQTMADQLGNAIENARLLQQMEQSMHELEMASGRLARESWRNFLVNYRRAFGYRYRLIDVEPASDLSPEAQAALQQQAPVVTTVAAEAGEGRLQGVLSVPIRVRNEVLGVLDLRFEDPQVSPEAISLVEQIAARLGAALESARLLEESRRAAAREQLMARVASSLRERLEIDAVLKNAARELRTALDLSRVAVRLAPRAVVEASQNPDGVSDP